jgi:hypothetical protein
VRGLCACRRSCSFRHITCDSETVFLTLGNRKLTSATVLYASSALYLCQDGIVKVFMARFILLICRSCIVVCPDPKMHPSICPLLSRRAHTACAASYMGTTELPTQYRDPNPDVWVSRAAPSKYSLARLILTTVQCVLCNTALDITNEIHSQFVCNILSAYVVSGTVHLPRSERFAGMSI